MKKFFFILIVFAMVSSLSVPAFAYPPAATDRTWNGGGTDSNWQTAANWGGTAPSAGDALTFSGTTQLSPVNNFDEGTTFTGILIKTGSGAFVTSGNGITVTGRGNGTVTGEWAVLNNEQSNSNTQTIGNKLTLLGSLSIECNSSTSLLKLTGDIVNNGVQTLLVKGAAGGVEIDGVISGSGGLQIGSNASGTNYVTLTNANTYTGMTTIDAGVLNIQNGSALGTVDKGTSVLNSGAALQIQGGIITLAEALTLNGTGISNDGALRSISGNNNYTGLVTLGSSTRINSDTVGQTLTLSNAGTIAGVGFGLTVGGSGNTTINSVIGTTSGTLTKDGTGTLTLSGANTYGGGTTISAGTLQVDGEGGTGTGDIVNNATMIINRSIDTPSGVNISGTGNFIKQDANVLTLSGLNTYTGAMTVNAGTLKAGVETQAFGIGSAVTIGALGTLDLNKYNVTIGSLAGSGTVTNTGAGEFILTMGVNNTSTSFSGLIKDGVGNQLTGITKEGTSTFTFSGVHTYSGATTITAGTLALGGATTIAGDIAHTLTSTLDLGANTLTLNGAGVLGNYTQTGTPTLRTTIQNATTAGNINASVATGTGKMTTLAASTLYVTVPTATTVPVGTKWTILDGKAGAGGVIAPATVTSSNPRVSFSAAAVNGTDDLELTVLTWNTANAYANAATSGNGAAAGAALDSITNPTGDMLYVMNTLDTLSDSQIAAALDTMVPEIDAGVINTSTTILNNFVGVTMERVEKLLMIAKAADSATTGVSAGEASKLSGVWGKGYGSWLTQGTRNNIAGYDAWNVGTALGIDRLFYDCVTLGISGGWAYGNVNSAATNNAKTNINSAQTTIYGGYSDQNLPYFIDAAGSFAYNWYNGKRDINVGPTINRTAKGKYGGQQYGAYLGGGYKFDVIKNIEFTPLISLQYNHLSLNSYTETGADALNLDINRQGYDQLQSGLGARVAAPMKCKWGTFTPEAHGKWFYDFIGDDMAVTSNFNGGGAAFGSNGCKPALNSFNVGGQLIFDFKNDVSIIGNCDTEMKNQFFGIYGSLTLRYDF